MSKDLFTLYLNNIWKPQLTVIGMSGLPQTSFSFSTMAKNISLKLSMRLPPTLKGEDAEKSLKEYFSNVKPLYNAKIELLDIDSGSGYCAKELKKETKDLFEKNA